MPNPPVREQLQSLFEKIADAYEGTIEQKHITDEYIDLKFLKDSTDGPVEVGHIRLFVENNVVINNQDEGLQLVRIVDHYGGPEVYVSPVVSAIIALSTR